MSVFATGRPRLALLLAGLLILAQATLAVRGRDAHLGHSEQPQGNMVLEIRKIGGETTGLARQAERPEKGLDQRQQNRLEEAGVDRLDTGLGDRTTGLAQAASGGHRGAASLLDPRTYRNAQYLGQVEVGGQHFQVLFDTGSALVLLNSDLCKAHACVTKNKYSGRLSPAHRDWQRSVSALFGNGLVKGRVASDTFSLAGLTLADQAFVQLEAPADTFLANAYFDGVVGLGLPGLAPPGVPAFMDTVQRRRLLPSTTFNFYFDRIHNLSRSYLSFGEPDLRFVGGALSYFPVVSDKYWAVRLARVLVGGKETALCSAGCTAILDTGSSLVSAPAAAAYQLLELLGVKADCGDLAALPTLTFDFGGQHFDLEAKDYVLATDLHAGGAAGQVREAKKCVAGVTPLNLPNSGQQGLWVLGDLFLSKFFVSFDMDKRRVGLGRPRVGVPLQERVKKLAAISEKPISESVESPESG